MSHRREQVIRLQPRLRHPLARALFPVARPGLEWISGLRGASRLYCNAPAGASGAQLLRSVLEELDVRVRVRDEDLSRIPESGPAMVVANHPFGAVEGMVLAVLLRARRDDAKILANYLLGRVPELRELFWMVDPFETTSAGRRNVASLRRAIRYVRQGGLLASFPSGEVASLDLSSRRVLDPPWSPTVGRIAKTAGCPVIPVYFRGRNGWAFQLAGLLHPAARTALLPRQLLARRGQTIEVRIGSPVSPARIAGFGSDEERVRYLRDRTEILSARRSAAVQPRSTPRKVAPIVLPVRTDRLAAEVRGLDPDQLLAAGDGQEVYLADSEQIPTVLREIGRLRELTFRAVGEGTGREIDLDRFDETYRHLFIWNPGKREIVGSYRVGRVDEILRRSGVDGLYTATLFRFRRELFERMGPALELGRSFIRPEYQKSYSGLMLLWKGIGEWIARNPRYATLFGPVSISAEYTSASQRLIVSFLKQNRYAHDLSHLVRPRTPFKYGIRIGRPTRPEHIRDLADVSTFISEIEADGKGVPVLLRQYLRLGGRLLGFNVDPEFSDVLDVLVMLDVRETPRRVMNRYMTRQAADRFVRYHDSIRSRAV